MDPKVLVAYATRAGSTAEVARTVAERLGAQGWNAMVQPVTRLTGLDDVQAIVLGSAIRYGAWLPEMTRFIESQGTTLRSLPLAIFTVHMQALDDSAASREARSRYTQPLHQLLRPRVEAFFAGRIDPARLSFFERLAVKMVKSPVGDRRDWDRIRDWADSLAVQLH